MLNNNAKIIACLLASLLSSPSMATCVGFENTSIPESTPLTNHTILVDGTLIAPATNLMWKRCREGRSLVNGVCEGDLIAYSWVDALNAANDADFAGHTDWRLPNPKELLSIFEDRCSFPPFNFDLFPIYDAFSAWTATPADITLQNIYTEVWYMGNDGSMLREGKRSRVPILLVRDLPQTTSIE